MQYLFDKRLRISYNIGMSKLLTVNEVAKMLGRQPSSIHRSIRRGHLRAVKYGRDWLIERADFEAYRDNPPQPGPKKHH